MKILLLSTSARGHAIADTLFRSPLKPEIINFTPKRNPGIDALAVDTIEIDVTDNESVVKKAREYRPDFAIIGPEDPLANGIVDALDTAGIPAIGPTKILAQVESSKGFTRSLLITHGIDANPLFKRFNSEESDFAIEKFIREELHEEYVVKYDALKGGKGVKVSLEHLQTVDEGVAYARECINECGSVVVEEKLIGVEFSLLSFVSGETCIDMPAVQDHKRAYEGDSGPNTGGMGTYSDANHSLPFLTEEDIARASEINKLTAKALHLECGEPYKGILYGGFIATKRGVQLIEYNARFGDPEALNILPILKSDFVTICQGIIDGSLSEEMVEFEHKATVCKYITPDCYPESKERIGEQVVFPETTDSTRIFYGDISTDKEGNTLLGGSRTAGIVGIADTIDKAEKKAQELCEKVEGPVRFRRDIGTKELIEKRTNVMKGFRGSDKQ